MNLAHPGTGISCYFDWPLIIPASQEGNSLEQGCELLIFGGSRGDGYDAHESNVMKLNLKINEKLDGEQSVESSLTQTGRQEVPAQMLFMPNCTVLAGGAAPYLYKEIEETTICEEIQV